MKSKARASYLAFYFRRNMSIVEPNTPKTSWTISNTIAQTTSLLSDESDILFVDEFGANLSDGIIVIYDFEAMPASWDSTDENSTDWAEAYAIATSGDRVTASGDVRVTADGDIRIMTICNSNKVLAHDWDGETNQTTSWADSYVLTSDYYLLTVSGDSRVTESGDIRVMAVSNNNNKPSTAWSEEY